ncbi:hypothetical protein IFM89_033859 [Coptis chinensis]|uniref:Uncharacterized protein n=1 Tax=Coptis chinensis TaxID=261450 RepID=A0A835LCF4_9MAGN|nr:hypothetical protein IFM89_033859 [Coptis chinensis]
MRKFPIPGFSADKTGLKRGAWTPEVDWCDFSKFTGLSRGGKSCKLRRVSYPQLNIKRGNYTREEEQIVSNLHQMLGNRWSTIAGGLPSRMENEINIHWHSPTKKCAKIKMTMKEAKREPVYWITLQEPEPVHALPPVILESSPIVPMSPKKFDSLSLSTDDYEVATTENRVHYENTISAETVSDIDGKLYTTSFLREDWCIPQDTTSILTPREEIWNPVEIEILAERKPLPNPLLFNPLTPPNIESSFIFATSRQSSEDAIVKNQLSDEGLIHGGRTIECAPAFST